jgi:hypothetical protein
MSLYAPSFRSVAIYRVGAMSQVPPATHKSLRYEEFPQFERKFSLSRWGHVTGGLPILVVKSH